MALLAAICLVAGIVANTSHAHEDAFAIGDDRGARDLRGDTGLRCAACVLAHSPAAPAVCIATAQTPLPTDERPVESARHAIGQTSPSLRSTRAPPTRS